MNDTQSVGHPAQDTKSKSPRITEPHAFMLAARNLAARLDVRQREAESGGKMVPYFEVHATIFFDAKNMSEALAKVQAMFAAADTHRFESTRPLTYGDDLERGGLSGD